MVLAIFSCIGNAIIAVMAILVIAQEGVGADAGAVESVQDFLIKLDMKPCMRLVEMNFLLKLCRIFPKKFSMKNIQLGDQLLLQMFLKFMVFKILYFLKLCPIFVGSVHNFGKSGDDKI